MQVRWDAVFLTMICLVCKGEGYGKENSSSSRRRNWPRNHGGWFRSSEALAEKQVLTMRLTDDRSEVQILMQHGLPYLMKPLRQVGKQMLSY